VKAIRVHGTGGPEVLRLCRVRHRPRGAGGSRSGWRRGVSRRGGDAPHYLAYSTLPLKPGDTCLVHAAAGGVGLLLCQIASRIGARVIGTAGSEAKARLAREAGAAEVILCNEVDFAEETPFDPQLLQQKGSLFLTRPTTAHYLASRSELLRRTEELMGWVKDGSLRVRIDRQLPLAAAAEAHAELEGRRTTGKVLLAP
jgi:NADPH2:quinone reductase